jgi:6-pyruvoyl-tetrahydropterin synthase
MAQEQRMSLDLTGVKKRLKDYEQMLQYYTLMRMKNRMKDFEPESKDGGRWLRNILQRRWKRIWFSIELMKRF